MKIVEGQFAGRQIQYKEQKGTRVTSDKVRKSVFDVLKGLVDFEGLKVADLFCGSGMYGIEALSRGAESIMFVDESRDVARQLKSNLSHLKVESYKVKSLDYEKFVKSCDEKFDLVFTDPPYYDFDFEKLNTVSKILNKHGIFVLEQSKRGGVKDLDGLELFLEKRYGDTVINFYKSGNL